MNRELVKESISQFEVAIDNLKQSLLEEDKPKHVIGNWYKYKDGSIFCVTSICERGVLYGYGFTDKGDWFDYSESDIGRCACNEVAKEFTTGANIKEVEESLIKEAKRRYKVGCTIKALLHNKSQNVTLIIKNEKGNLYWDNTFYYGNYIVLNNGKWAEVIEQDKFGDVIATASFLSCKRLVDRMNNPKKRTFPFFGTWSTEVKNVKIGDWVQLSSSNIRKVLTNFEADKWSHLKPLTQQEVIDLLSK